MDFYTPPTIVAGYIVFRSVRSSVCPSVRPSVRHTLLTLIFSGTTSHIVMKFCTLTHYIKDNILQLKMGSLVNVCSSEKLRFTFLLTFLTTCRAGYPCLRRHMLVYNVLVNIWRKFVMLDICSKQVTCIVLCGEGCI